MFNMFPQTDFRQMDLGYVLDVVKRANETIDGFDDDKAELNNRIDVLSDSINNPTTGVWRAIADIHAANSSQQQQINELIAHEIFVTPEMYGAVGDGVADDTAALQAAFNSTKPVFMGGDYGITSTLVINQDKLVVCGEKCVIRTLAQLTYAIRFGVDTTPAADSALTGLIQVLWYGGTLLAPDANTLFVYGFSIEKCLNGYLYGVTVKNCYGTGFRWGGDYGANTIADNCIVIGPTSGNYGNCGYLVGRNDQRLYNCSAVDMVKGFYTDRGYTRFHGCYCWLTRYREDDIANVVGYDIVSTTCAVIDCTIDTLPVGIKLYPTSTNFYASGLSWLSNTSLLPNTTDYVLFKGSESSVSTHGFVVGVQSVSWATDVNIVSDITGLQIIGFTCGNTTHVLDYATAVIDLTAGGGGGAQADWQENDSSADSYVQNRTHWLDGTTYHKLDANYLPYYNGDTTRSTQFNQGTATGEDSLAANGSTASGLKSAAFGLASIASAEYTFAAGQQNEASQLAATCFGKGNYANAMSQMTCGEFSSQLVTSAADRQRILFKVGDGSNAALRHDALQVTLAGHVIARTGLYIGSTGLTEQELIALKALLNQ